MKADVDQRRRAHVLIQKQRRRVPCASNSARLKSGVAVSWRVAAVHQKLVRARPEAEASLVGCAGAVRVAFNDLKTADRRECKHAQQAAKHVTLFKLRAVRHFFFYRRKHL